MTGSDEGLEAYEFDRARFRNDTGAETSCAHVNGGLLAPGEWKGKAGRGKLADKGESHPHGTFEVVTASKPPDGLPVEMLTRQGGDISDPDEALPEMAAAMDDQKQEERLGSGHGKLAAGGAYGGCGAEQDCGIEPKHRVAGGKAPVKINVDAVGPTERKFGVPANSGGRGDPRKGNAQAIAVAGKCANCVGRSARLD
jgi:hypothetical protein